MHEVESFPYEIEVVEHLEIPMADGVRLAARIWRPVSSHRKPVPAVLEYLPYRKRDLTRVRDSINGPWLAGHGFAFVRVDIRGCGDSEGLILDQYSEAELSDGEQVIAWLAAQPWCTGRVGMLGLSWGGFNALQIAARQPPALGAIVTVCSTDDTYTDNMHYMGGCLLSDNLSEATTMLAFQSCPPDPAVVGERWRAMWQERLDGLYPWLERWLSHPLRDAYWEATSVCQDYRAITCPVMAVSGWEDGFSDAVFRLVAHLDVPRMGLVGPWSHMYPHRGVPGPAVGFLQEVKRWFDQWLRGVESGVTQEPALRVWMQDSMPPQFTAYRERRGRWVAERSWPSPRIEERRLPLDTHRVRLDGSRAPDAQPVSIRSPLTVGLYAGKWCSYAATPDLPGDQREEDGGSLVFESAPLPEALEILGAAVVELVVAADKPVAQVAVRLSDVLPDGRVTRVTYGLLELTHRDGNDRVRPVVPGQPMRVRVQLNGVAQRFPAGHRLRVSVSSSYWPLAWPPPEHTTLTVHPADSALILPVRPATADDDILRPFEEPEGAPPIELRYLTPPEENWRVVRDLAADVSTLEVIRHDGYFRIEEIDLEIVKQTIERYSARADDYDSIRGETETVRAFQRDGWSTRIETRSVLTSSADTFRLHATVDAWEGDERIYARTWTHSFPRGGR